MKTIFDNRILVAAVAAWAIAQLSKTLFELFRYLQLKLSRLVSSGGMPSSHSALVSSLATATGRVTGIDSAAFAISLVLAVIVMYDAAGVRRRQGTIQKIGVSDCLLSYLMFVPRANTVIIYL